MQASPFGSGLALSGAMRQLPKGGAFQGEVRPYEELNYDFSH